MTRKSELLSAQYSGLITSSREKDPWHTISRIIYLRETMILHSAHISKKPWMPRSTIFVVIKPLPLSCCPPVQVKAR